MLARPPARALRLDTNRICAACLRRISRAAISPRARSSSTAAATSSPTVSRDVFKQYFWANDLRANGIAESRRQIQNSQRVADSNSDAISASPSSPRPAEDAVPTQDHVLPHRRRKQRRKAAEDAAEQPLPLDASSQLSSLASSSRSNSLKQRFYTYLSLSKPRLTALIVLTTTASYSLYPVAISPFAAHLSLSPWTLVTLTTGTALASASANAFNMLFEPKYDAKMSRTKARPLVRGLITSRAALLFAVLAGVSGTAVLWYGVNPTVAGLGALNILLYAGIYTPLKRLSVLNTWAGALVGGIPPLMGWAAAAGQALTARTGAGIEPGWQDLLFASDGSSTGGWLLAGLLFAWQFPHFWALAYPLRHEYAAAGYKMLVSSNVPMAGRSALRYSLAMFPLTAGLCAAGVTGWWFAGASAVVNAWMTREAWQFWRRAGAGGSARGLFWASVWHLPLTLVLAMVAKRGVWERVFWGGMDAEELRMWQEDEDLEEEGER